MTTVFAWCRAGTTEPVKIGNNWYFTKKQFAVSAWESAHNHCRFPRDMSPFLSDYTVMEFDITPKNSHPVLACPVCDERAIGPYEKRNHGGKCQRCS